MLVMLPWEVVASVRRLLAWSQASHGEVELYKTNLFQKASACGGIPTRRDANLDGYLGLDGNVRGKGDFFVVHTRGQSKGKRTGQIGHNEFGLHVRESLSNAIAAPARKGIMYKPMSFRHGILVQPSIWPKRIWFRPVIGMPLQHVKGQDKFCIRRNRVAVPGFFL